MYLILGLLVAVIAISIVTTITMFFGSIWKLYMDKINLDPVDRYSLIKEVSKSGAVIYKVYDNLQFCIHQPYIWRKLILATTDKANAEKYYHNKTIDSQWDLDRETQDYF